jgi:hypothetical protein
MPEVKMLIEDDRSNPDAISKMALQIRNPKNNFFPVARIRMDPRVGARG